MVRSNSVGWHAQNEVMGVVWWLGVLLVLVLLACLLVITTPFVPQGVPPEKFGGRCPPYGFGSSASGG